MIGLRKCLDSVSSMKCSADVNLRLIVGAAVFLSLGLVAIWLWPGGVPLLTERFAGQARRTNRERWYQEANTPPPTLLEIKTAAEDGDAGAQYNLAQVYASEQDFANAINWYRKAAEQGCTNAQLALGETLLQGRKQTVTSADVPPDADEGVLWLGRAANQGGVQAQIQLGGCYQRGTGVEPNLIEAYKWFALAARQSNAVARVGLEHLQLQMSRPDIAAGQHAAQLFLPNKNEDLPQPAYLGQVRLNGVSLSGNKPLAIVNNRTLGESEQTSIKLNGKTMQIRCLKIAATSVLVQVGPFRKQLRLAD